MLNTNRLLDFLSKHWLHIRSTITYDMLTDTYEELANCTLSAEYICRMVNHWRCTEQYTWRITNRRSCIEWYTWRFTNHGLCRHEESPIMDCVDTWRITNHGLCTYENSPIMDGTWLVHMKHNHQSWMVRGLVHMKHNLSQMAHWLVHVKNTRLHTDCYTWRIANHTQYVHWHTKSSV